MVLIEINNIMKINSRKKYCALVIDTDDIQRKGLVLALKKNFYDIVSTSSPIEAIKIVKNKQIDVIITELKFTIIDGLEVIKSLKKSAPNAEFLIWSAHISKKLKTELEQNGIYRFISKPIDLKFLQNEIFNIINNINSKIFED